MVDAIKFLPYLFDRPSESVITPKGDDQVLFQLTSAHVPPDYENNGVEINNRFGSESSMVVPLKELANYPKFTIASQLPKDADFSYFLSRHQNMASEVIGVLMSVPENETQDFLSTCVYARSRLNPELFNYCFSVALMHRKDTKNVPIQNLVETFPYKFMNSQVFQQARETAAVVPQDVRVSNIRFFLSAQ